MTVYYNFVVDKGPKKSKEKSTKTNQDYRSFSADAQRIPGKNWFLYSNKCYTTHVAKLGEITGKIQVSFSEFGERILDTFG